MIDPDRHARASLAPIDEDVLVLAWSLWAELGVPGWTRRHQDWAIDPEPLILFTASLGESDARLRDECIRWCVRNSRSISIARLRNLLKTGVPAVRARWGPFAATVNALGDAGWPDATQPLPARPSAKEGKEGLDDFRRPAAISLRLRTTFGVSARSEILLYFISRPDARASAADLAEVVHYSKRNVEKELAALRKAGMLDVEAHRNRREHFVVQPESLLLFAAPRPAHYPRWDALFAVLGSLLEYEARVGSMDPVVATIEARRILKELVDAARTGSLPPLPGAATGHALLAAILDWGGRITQALGHADTASLGWLSTRSIALQDWRARPAEGVRGIASPLLATATDLAVWADTRAAQGRMPDLLRRLVLATTDGLRRVDMPAGEAIQQGGYDGIVVTTAPTSFVPDGSSAWEIGVSSDVKRKADSDYQKRSANPLDIDPASATFIFVSPRRWASKRKWEKERRDEGIWRDVRVLDADDLETWLGLAPTVHVWLSALLGKNWASVQDLRSYWSDWREATRPALSAQVVLAGREDVADALRERIARPEVLLRVQGESADEALACIAAATLGLEQADALLALSLVINDAAGWDWAVNATGPLILIPRFADPTTAAAIRHGHRVLIPVGREGGSPDDLVLPRLRRDALRSALIGIGVQEDAADDLAARGRASLTSLRRSLAIDQGLARPAWAHRSEAPALLPALLAGAWDARKPGDQELISQLAERSYQEVERRLVHWAGIADPPIRMVGSIWFLVSKEDAWHLLSAHLAPADLAQFRTALLRALGIPDPALDLPPEERWLAHVHGYEHPLSEQVREGLVDTLAIMGARSGDTHFYTGHTGVWHADTITRDLLDLANADRSGKLWSSLSDVLPLLAEAAPESFLDAVNVALSREPSPLLTLFTDTGASAATIFVTSRHTGLLRALETLGWSADYLDPVARHFATLSQLDPGGTLANRPFNSLRSLFLLWDPQTTAPPGARLNVLDHLRRHAPALAWRLLLAILPERHGVSVPSHVPRWRDWKDGHRQGVPPGEVHLAVEAVVDRLLEDVGADGSRWADLLAILRDFPQDRVVSALERIPPTTFSEGDRTTLWSALRSVISTHRRFSAADWALPPAVVDRLARVYERLTPHDPVQRYAWLFAQRPNLLTGSERGWAHHHEAIAQAQAEAIRTVYDAGGLAAVLRLAHLAEVPEVVGQAIALAGIAASGNEQERLFDLLDAPEAADCRLAYGYAARRFNLEGWPWVGALLARKGPAWSPEERAAFLRALPVLPETWDWAAHFGEDTERAYWSTLSVPGCPEPVQVERAAGLLLRYERPAHAVYLLAMCLQGSALRIDADLIVQALEQLAHQGSHGQWGELADDVGTLLDYLARSGTVAVSRLAPLEWVFLPILRGLEQPTTVLGRQLAQDPAFFVDVLRTVFRAHDEEPGETPDEQQAVAMRGYQLLDSWRRPPGYRDDGALDEETMNAWVDAARVLAAEQKREKTGDQRIGRVLSYLPSGPDGLWPHPAVRRLVERLASRDLETGLELGLRNSRGVTLRGAHDGGAQERAMQTHYLSDAQQLSTEWPRTAAMVRRIARAYAAEARWQDDHAEIADDRWR